MPITIKLTFPAGRYHATPWGRHVNEGVAEWPPSPWRLLRALIAVWKRTCPDVPEQQVQRLLSAIVQPPQFKLPDHRVAHTRHYMPWEKKGPQDRTLVFDTFVCIGRHDPLYIGWPDAELPDDDRRVLSQLLGNLSSLGRCEGWVEGTLHEGSVEWNCKRNDTDPNPIPVFCPDSGTAFGDEYYPKLDSNKLAEGKVNPAEYLFDCPRWHLCLDTETIHDKKWPTVPGAKWVNYSRPVETTSPTVSSKSFERPKPTLARFLLDAPVLPHLTDTLRVAEAFRIAAMSRFKGWCLRNPEAAAPFQRPDRPDTFCSPTLSGKTIDSEIRQGHQHAYYLPTAEGDDRLRLTHVTVHAAEGFGPGEVAALSGIRFLKLGDERAEIRVQLVGLGNPADFTAPLLQPAAVWESATPFLITRFPKRSGRKRDQPHDYATPLAFAALLVRDELTRLRERRPESPLVEAIEPMEVQGYGPNRTLRSLQFQRFRLKRNDDGGRRPNGAFRIVFERPVSGPICLGHSAHFGLGLFLPA